MTVSITHKFHSAKTDGVDTSVVQPSDWNDEHTITCGPGTVLGRTVGLAGAVQELPISVTSTGDVGIGTTAPTEKLHVAGKIRSEGNFTLAGTTGHYFYPYYASATNHSSIHSDNNGNMVFSTGTTTVEARLTLGGTQALFATPVSSTTSTGAGVAGNFKASEAGHSGFLGNSQDGGAYAYIGYQNANAIYTSAIGSRTVIRAVATSGVGVHATSNGSIAVYGVNTGGNAAGVYGVSVANYGVDGRTGNFSSGGVIGFSSLTSVYGILGYGNYSIYGSTSAILATGAWLVSDVRFKQVKDESPFTKPALDIVNALPIRAYRLMGPLAAGSLNGPDQFGWIAQEVEQEIPVAVSEIIIPPGDLAQRAFLKGVDTPEPGTPEAAALAEGDVTFKGLNEKYLVATLWAAVQELSAKVERLEKMDVQG